MNYTYSGGNNTTTLKLLNRGDLNGTSYNRLYKTKVYENGELIAEYIPCYRKSDRIVGFYNPISNTFYFDDKGINFIAGPEIE